MNTEIVIKPEKFTKFLLGIIFFLLIGHLMYVFTQLVYGYKLRYIFQVFYFNSEGNFPTLYSVAALTLASLLLFFVGYLKKVRKNKFANQWLVLGGLFFLLSYDEAAEMHERLKYIREYLPESSMDFLYFAWVIPYAALTLFIGIFFIRFLLGLPRKTAGLFIVAGTIFVTGAIGFELLNSYYWTGSRVMLHLVITVEELLEMLGIVLFIYAILSYIKTEMGPKIGLMLNNSPTEDVTVQKKVYNIDKSPDLNFNEKKI